MSIELMMLSNSLILCHLPSPPAFSLSQYQGLFQWVSSSGDQVLEIQLQHQSSQCIFQGWFPLELIGLITLLSKGLSKVFSSTTVSFKVSDFRGCLVNDSLPRGRPREAGRSQYQLSLMGLMEACPHPTVPRETARTDLCTNSSWKLSFLQARGGGGKPKRKYPATCPWNLCPKSVILSNNEGCHEPWFSRKWWPV